jgi:hypothetical protein
MEEFAIPMKLINLTEATIKREKRRIKLQGYLSEPFITETGLRQGDMLACLLFNIQVYYIINQCRS